MSSSRTTTRKQRSTTGVRASFWLLVAVGVLVEGGTAYLALQALASRLSCHVPTLQLSTDDLAACVRAVPLVGRHAWLPALAIGLVAASSIVLGAIEAVRGVRVVRKHWHTIWRSPEPLAETVATVERLGYPHTVVVSSERAELLTVGLLRPYIVVTARAVEVLDPDELEASLAHEATHQRRRDPLRLAVASVIAHALWFIPTLRELVRSAELASELEADIGGTELHGDEHLVGALTVLVAEVIDPPAGSSPMARLDLVSERLDALTTGHVCLHIRRSFLALSVVLIVVLAALGLAVPHDTPAPTPLHVHRLTVTVPDTAHPGS